MSRGRGFLAGRMKGRSCQGLSEREASAVGLSYRITGSDAGSQYSDLKLVNCGGMSSLKVESVPN